MSGERLARLVSWVGVAIGGVATLGLVAPPRSRLRRLIYPAAPADAEYAAGARAAAPLMAGWTALLAWVADDPVERRKPLLFTAVPVVAGLAAVELADVRDGRSRLGPLAPTLGPQGLLLGGFLAAFRRSARDAATR